MAGCGKKKMNEGGVTGRTSKKAKEDQKEFQMGYKQGLKAAKQEFNLKGKESLDEDKKAGAVEKLFSPKKIVEGREKGASDMKAALKGQGAYKKGGMVKKCKRDGVCVKGKTKGRMV